MDDRTPGPVRYEAMPVRQILRNMKTLSELMVDLAYSALLFSDRHLARWVMELEDDVDRLGMQLLMTLSMSVRSKHDAELSVGLFQVARSADKISDAAADLAALALSGAGTRSALRRAFEQVDEQLTRVIVAADSSLVGKSLGELWEDQDLTVDVIAVRRNGLWTVNPTNEFVVQPEDVIFARGSGRKVDELELQAEGTAHPGHAAGSSTDDIDSLVVDLKETSEFMVSLAYASVVHNDVELARQVGALEERTDNVCEVLIRRTLVLDEDIDRKWGLIRLAVATEEIADAAWEIASVPLSGLETHHVIASIVTEAEETVAMVEVKEGSPLDGRTLRELVLEDKYGVYVRSVRRSGHWFHRPRPEFRLRAGDTLIVDGYRHGIAALKRELGQE